MKDYELNYVHQDSRTVPDTKYAFEQSMKTFQDIPPRTVASVLLERWAKDTREMAIARIQFDTSSGECIVDHDGRTVYYQTYDEALAGEIAYLNSAEEEQTND